MGSRIGDGKWAANEAFITDRLTCMPLRKLSLVCGTNSVPLKDGGLAN